MSIHEYFPEQALQILLEKLLAKDETLVTEVWSAIDAGKEVLIEPDEPSRDLFGSQTTKIQHRISGGRANPGRLSHEEALRVALDVLRAYFVVQPRFVTSVVHHLSDSREAEDSSLEPFDAEAGIEIDLWSETQLDEREGLVFRFDRVEEKEIDEQEQNLNSLIEFIQFTGD